MKLTGLISPNYSEETLADAYKVFPEGIRIEGRTLTVKKYTDDEFRRAEQAFADLVHDLARRPLDFLMITGELFLSYKGPGSDRQILETVKKITPTARFDNPDSSHRWMSRAGTEASGHGYAVSGRSGRTPGAVSGSRRH